MMHRSNGPLQSPVWWLLLIMVGLLIVLIGWAWATHPYLFPMEFPFK